MSQSSQSNGSSNGAGSWGWMPTGDLFPERAEAPEAQAALPAERPLPKSKAPSPSPQRRVVALPPAQASSSQDGALPLQAGGAPAMAGPPQPHPAMMAYPPRGGMTAPRQLGQAEMAAAEPAFDTFHQHLFGASTVIVGAGSLLGGHFGGLYGGIAGALAAGAGINALRAAHAGMQPDPARKKEATISAIYAVIGAGMSAYVWWKLDRKRGPRRATRNPRRSKRRSTETRRNEPRDCGFRPVGP